MAEASYVSEETWKDKLVDDIPAVCMAEMGSKLSIGTGPGYKDLAALINFSAAQVQQFQLEDATNPGRVLLERWSQLPDATVRVLNIYLEKIGRHDVIRILKEHLADFLKVNSLFPLLVISNPGRVLLERWSQLPDATVRVLNIYLEKIGRHDVIRILKEHLAGPCVLVIIVRELHDNKNILEDSLWTFQGETVRDALKDSQELVKHNIDIENLQYDGQTTVRGHFLDFKCKMFMGKQVTLKACLCPNNTMRPRKITDPNISTRVKEHPSERKAYTQEVSRKVKSLDRFAKLTEEITPCMSTKTENDYEELEFDENRAKSLSSKDNERSDETNSQLEQEQSSCRSSSGDSGTVDIVNSRRKSFDSQLSLLDTVNMTDPTNHLEEDLDSMSLDLRSDVSLISSSDTENPYENIEVPAFHHDAMTYEIIEQRLKDHLNQDGSYIVRPSRQNPDINRSISIVLGRQIINYRIFVQTQLINGNHRSEYALCQEEGPWFPTVIALVSHYKSHRMPEPEDNMEGPFLLHPVTKK